MIFDNIRNLNNYESLVPGIKAIEDFLSRNDAASIAEGRYEIGGGVYVTVSSYATKDDAPFETHRDHIDLQYIVSGTEAIAYTDAIHVSDGDDYDPAKDTAFYHNACCSQSVVLAKDDFAIFFPSDAHKPALKVNGTEAAVRKLLFKLPTPETEYMAYLLQLLPKIKMPERAVEKILPVAEKLSKKTLDDLTYAYFADRHFDEKLNKICRDLEIPDHLANLVIYLFLGKETYYHYLDRHIDPSIFFDSMTDIVVWELTCEKDRKDIGLLETGWIDCTLRQAIYRLGRFQYEPTTFESADIRIGDHIVKKGDRVLSVHIPEGGSMTEEARRDSYERAIKFFSDYEHHVFVCDSWLLYPGHYKCLPETSNIIGFMNDFSIIHSHEHRGTGDLWRIYGFDYDLRDFESLPETTSVQRYYKKYLIETQGKNGSGYGVFMIENGKHLK